MSQPAGEKNIIDFVKNDDKNGVRVYQAGFSQKFFFPATNDILINYAPIRNKPGPQQDVTSFMGRIKLRAKYVAGTNNELKLTDADSRDAKTVADEQYKYFKPTDPCPAITVGSECATTNGCMWANKVCSAAKGDGCENNNLKPIECAKVNKCFYNLGLCA